MGEFVAVNDSLMLFDMESLKREALMFHRIALPFVNQILTDFREENSRTPQVLAELEWLMDKGVVFEPEDKTKDEKLLSSDEFKSYATLASKFVLPSDESQNTPADDLLQVDGNEVKLSAEWQRRFSDNLAICGLNARYFSVQLRVLDNMDSYPVLSGLIPAIQERNSSKDNVIQIVLNALPVPDDSTPWEQILEYRNDGDSYHKFLDLRNWMGEVARSELSPVEVEQKLDHLISQYQRHMNLHKMKTKPGVLQTIIVTPADFVENLIKFNWGKIARNLFTLKQRRIALLEGELNAPGSEVAYIIKSRDAFPQRLA
jgi:hypothetical protein